MKRVLLQNGSLTFMHKCSQRGVFSLSPSVPFITSRSGLQQPDESSKQNVEHVILNHVRSMFVVSLKGTIGCFLCWPRVFILGFLTLFGPHPLN